jgi:hypothetical protein
VAKPKRGGSTTRFARGTETQRRRNTNVAFISSTEIPWPKKTLRFLGEGNSQREERFFILLFLFELLQEGLREF